jgi:hypothetical protein
MPSSSDPKREFLRHTLATVAYRGGKALRNAPDSFANFTCGEGGRTPAQILAHMGDLMDWAFSMAMGQEKWNNATPLPWPQENERFFAAIKAFDDYLASSQPLAVTPEKLFQGPMADSLNHVGQIAMLRRLAGVPIKGENYSVATIAAGTVGAQQAAPKREF